MKSQSKENKEQATDGVKRVSLQTMDKGRGPSRGKQSWRTRKKKTHTSGAKRAEAVGGKLSDTGDGQLTAQVRATRASVLRAV